MPRAYAPNLKTIWLVNDLQRVLRPQGATVRLLPTSVRGNRRVQITKVVPPANPGEVGTVETVRVTLATARQIVEDLS